MVIGLECLSLRMSLPSQTVNTKAIRTTVYPLNWPGFATEDKDFKSGNRNGNSELCACSGEDSTNDVRGILH